MPDTFATIQAAVDVSADGDVVLVNPGTYPPFEIAGKGVSVVANQASVFVTAGGILVRDTLVQHLVVLSGLTAHGKKQGELVIPALMVRDARGPVRVEGCFFVGSLPDVSECNEDGCPGTQGTGGDAVHLFRALDVSFVSSTAVGGRGTNWPFDAIKDGGHGILVRASKLSFFQSTSTGGRGGDGDNGGGGSGGVGGAGIDGRVAPGDNLPVVVHLSGALVRGGNGGDGGPPRCWDPAGPGGHALVLARTGSPSVEGIRLDSVLIGGVAGCGNPPAPSGSALQLTGGATVTQLQGSTRGLRVQSPVRESQPMQLQLQGNAGDTFFVMRGTAAGFAPRLDLGGVLHLDPLGFSRPVFVGSLPSSSLTVELDPPKLPNGYDGLAWFLQAFVRDGASGRWLSAPATPVVIDSSY